MPTENGLVIAAEKPKHAASIQTPKPVIVSKPIESINTITSGNSVTSSSNIPNKLPNAIKIKVAIQTTSFFLSANFLTVLLMIIFVPFVFSSRLKTPLITNKNTLIIITVKPSLSDANTRKGAVITRHAAIPFAGPCVNVSAIIISLLSREYLPCGTIYVSSQHINRIDKSKDTTKKKDFLPICAQGSSFACISSTTSVFFCIIYPLFLVVKFL